MMFSTLRNIFKICKKSQGTTFLMFFKFLYYKIFYSKQFYISNNTTIRGVKNISTSFPFKVGTTYNGFVNNDDSTYLNINGKLILNSEYEVGKGCRLDIGDQAIVEIGAGGYINAFTKLVIVHGLKIGENSVVSWDVQFLDEDFHTIDYENKINRSKKIILGDHVWIGCGAKIYQGTIIPSGCVIASDSIVRGVFTKKNCIIGGNPAKIIKENITWK